ncbi:MAG TPA: cobyric acid synthase, partial [Puia sp.]|nr:cobyric acid synthase [Puia sp.]
GVFGSLYGTMALLEPEEKQCIKGIIINKFRGDPALFEGGRAQLEELCQVPVVGVLPFSRDIFIEEEDSVALKQKHSGLMGGLAGWPAARKVNIAVVLLHRLSNFTDFNRLERDPRVNLFYTRDANEIGKADIVILPGSKNTIGDLLALKNNGMAEAVRKAAEDQRTVIGICGGYQMMGEWVEDPLHVETGIEHISGLGLLPVGTVMGMEKTTRQCSFRFQDRPEICEGYEIHMGESVVLTEERPLNHFPDGSTDGYFLHDKCWGTYLHGLFDNPVIIDRLLAPYTDLPGEDFDYRQYKEDQYDRLAGLIRQHIDMGNIYKTLQF